MPNTAAGQVFLFSVTADVSFKEKKEETVSRLLRTPTHHIKDFQRYQQERGRCCGEERLPAVWLGQQCGLCEAIGLLNDRSLGFKERLCIGTHKEPYKCVVTTIPFNVLRVLRHFSHRDIFLFLRNSEAMSASYKVH